MTNAVNTARVERRSLRFERIEDVVTDVDRIVAAEQAGTLRTLGNWTAGQILGHVAAWINYGYEGYPLGPPPWFVRWILRLMGRRYLRKGMPAGVKIPGAAGGTYGFEPLATAEAAEQMRRAFQRLQSGESCPYDSPAFGPMSHADRIQLNLRHAELHLGFLRYD